MAPTRAQVMRRAEAYLRHVWKGSERNVFHGFAPDGGPIETPDNDPRGWRPGEPSVGVPYALGAFDTPDSFDRAIKAGFPAGSTAYDMTLPGPLYSRYSAGIDCSGLVSRCWGLGQVYTTAELPQICVSLPTFAELLPGDIINKARDHVFLFERFADGLKSQVDVIEAGAWKVKRSRYPVAWMKAEGYLPLRDARRL